MLRSKPHCLSVSSSFVLNSFMTLYKLVNLLRFSLLTCKMESNSTNLTGPHSKLKHYENVNYYCYCSLDNPQLYVKLIARCSRYCQHPNWGGFCFTSANKPKRQYLKCFCCQVQFQRIYLLTPWPKITPTLPPHPALAILVFSQIT